MSISDNQSGITVSYTYDEVNRVATETQSGQTITYAYDANGNRETMTVPGVGTFNYTYDALTRLETLTNPATQVTQFKYYANDLRERVTYHNGSYTEYVYDPVNRLVAINHRKGDGSIIASYDYSYDNMNNRVSVTDHNAVTISYGYDKTYKLTSAAYPGEIISYSYDPVGNRISMTDSSGTYDFNHHDAANRLQFYTRPDTSQVDFTHDNNGNIQTSADGTATTAYTYDVKDQLRQITYPDTSTNDFLYDPTGRRTRAVDSLGIRRFLYDGQNNLADISGDDIIPIIATSYTPSLGIDDLISMHQGAATYYYLRDGLNSVRYIQNSDETIQASYEYNPYGGIRSQNGTTDNLFAFTGRRVEPDSGLMYYRSRYYNPSIGRFLKKDSYKSSLLDPLGLHRYVYVKNNPVNWVDPKGETTEAITMQLAAIILISQATMVYLASSDKLEDPEASECDKMIAELGKGTSQIALGEAFGMGFGGTYSLDIEGGGVREMSPDQQEGPTLLDCIVMAKKQKALKSPVLTAQKRGRVLLPVTEPIEDQCK